MDDLSHTKCFFLIPLYVKISFFMLPNLVHETALLSKYSYYPPYYYSYFSHKKRNQDKRGL